MPLYQKSRIEIYVPASLNVVYDRLLRGLESELTQKHGGCSVIEGIRGNYKMEDGSHEKDRIRLLYVDLPFSFDDNYEALCVYTDLLRKDIGAKLGDEEAIYVVSYGVYLSGS